MIYSACTQIRAYPLWRCVKVGDTVSDIEEGSNAGACTVGITRTGNLVGVGEEAWSKLDRDRKKTLLECATKRLKDAGADFVLESVAELPSILEQVEQQMERRTNK
jgi:phosphonoacetaldehyde hydrolase